MVWQRRRAYDGKIVPERRRHVRIDDKIMLSIMKLSECAENEDECRDPESFRLVPVNISAVGMSFYTDVYLSEGTAVRLIMKFDDFEDSMHFPDGIIAVEGVVVRVDRNDFRKLNHIAIDFRHINTVVENTLSKIIFLREREQMAIGQIL